MRAGRTSNLIVLFMAASVATSGGALATDPPEETEIDEIIMYAIESSSPAKLMRYFFKSDTYVLINEVWTEDGVPVDDGQLVQLEVSNRRGTDSQFRNGILVIRSAAFTLTVTGTDESGNSDTVSVDVPLRTRPPR